MMSFLFYVPYGHEVTKIWEGEWIQKPRLSLKPCFFQRGCRCWLIATYLPFCFIFPFLLTVYVVCIANYAAWKILYSFFYIYLLCDVIVHVFCKVAPRTALVLLFLFITDILLVSLNRVCCKELKIQGRKAFAWWNWHLRAFYWLTVFGGVGQ